MAEICPACGTVLRGYERTCPDCGEVLEAGASVGRGTRSGQGAVGGVMGEMTGKVVKLLVGVGVLVLLGWLGWSAIAYVVRSTEVEDPYPTDPAAATREFFTAIAAEDVESAYRSLNVARKAATVIGQNTRSRYAEHFERIRAYLRRYAGEDFIETMEVGEHGRHVVFGDGIELTVNFEVRGDDEKHYAIEEVKEFPIDVMPELGVEQHNRMLQRVTESIEALDEENVDDPAVVVRQRPGEGETQRLTRLFKAFERARMLDTRHRLLEWILQEYAGKPSQHGMLKRKLEEVAEDKREVPQLRELAAWGLGQLL